MRPLSCATRGHPIASYFSHVLGRSKSAKLASTGHAGLHAPQSISWVRFLEACIGFFSGVIVAGMSDYRHKRYNVSSSRICCTMSSSFCWGRGLGLQRAGPRCGVCTRALWRRCPPRVGLARRRPLVEEIIPRGALAYHPCPPHWGQSQRCCVVASLHREGRPADRDRNGHRKGSSQFPITPSYRKEGVSRIVVIDSWEKADSGKTDYQYL
jgi:hypothetical protein